MGPFYRELFSEAFFKSFEWVGTSWQALIYFLEVAFWGAVGIFIFHKNWKATMVQKLKAAFGVALVAIISWLPFFIFALAKAEAKKFSTLENENKILRDGRSKEKPKVIYKYVTIGSKESEQELLQRQKTREELGKLLGAGKTLVQEMYNVNEGTPEHAALIERYYTWKKSVTDYLSTLESPYAARFDTGIKEGAWRQMHIEIGSLEAFIGDFK